MNQGEGTRQEVMLALQEGSGPRGGGGTGKSISRQKENEGASADCRRESPQR